MRAIILIFLHIPPKDRDQMVKNSSESCFIVENSSWWPFSINALNPIGLIPCWNTGVGDGCWKGSIAVDTAEENGAGCEFRPLNKPSATLCIWHSIQSAGRDTVQTSEWSLVFSFQRMGESKWSETQKPCNNCQWRIVEIIHVLIWRTYRLACFRRSLSLLVLVLKRAPRHFYHHK